MNRGTLGERGGVPMPPRDVVVVPAPPPLPPVAARSPAATKRPITDDVSRRPAVPPRRAGAVAFRGRRALHDAVIAMTVFGPCRANDPL
jgi:hypothetical protein